MNGDVFEIHVAQLPKGKFQDTLDTMKIYSSTVYTQDIDSLNSLFISLMGPTVDTTTELVGHDTTDATGTTNVLPLSKFLEIVYSEEIKIWIKDTKIFKAILYNIVWGQCSKLT